MPLALAFLGLLATDTVLVLAATEIGWEQPITAAVILVAALSGFVWFKPAVDAVIKAKDERIAALEAGYTLVTAQRDALLDSQINQVLPAVLQSNNLFERVIPLIEKAVR